MKRVPSEESKENLPGGYEPDDFNSGAWLQQQTQGQAEHEDLATKLGKRSHMEGTDEIESEEGGSKRQRQDV